MNSTTEIELNNDRTDIKNVIQQKWSNVWTQLIEFKEHLKAATANFIHPIKIISLETIDGILSSFVLIRTFYSLETPFEMHFLRWRTIDAQARELISYLKKGISPQEETSPIILVNIPLHLETYQVSMNQFLKETTTKKKIIYFIGPEAPETNDFVSLGKNVSVPWTTTVLATIFSLELLKKPSWWHYFSAILCAFYEHLDVGISSNYDGIIEQIINEAIKKGLLESRAELDVPTTSSNTIVDALNLIFSKVLSDEDSISKFLLRCDVELRDQKTSAIRRLDDLSVAEKTRLVSGLIQHAGLNPEAIIRKTLIFKFMNEKKLNIKEINMALIDFVSSSDFDPRQLLKIFLLLPNENKLWSLQRKNGFNVATTLHDTIKTMKNSNVQILQQENYLWFKLDLKVPVIIKVEAANFLCRQTRKSIVFTTISSSNNSESPMARNHLIYFYLKDGEHLTTKKYEKNIEKVSKFLVGFQLHSQPVHRAITFQTDHDVNLEQINLIINTMLEGD